MNDSGNLALFDFDGTITYGDSFARFILTSVGHEKFIGGIIKHFPWLLGYELNIFPNSSVKRRIFSHFFRGWTRDRMNSAALSFTHNSLSEILRPKALERISWHKRRGDTVVVVSASFEEYLKYWCHEYSILLLGTKAEYVGDLLSGNLATANCYGPEKVRRIKEKFDLFSYEKVYAYGDSKGDEHMLGIAHEKHYRPFR